MKPETNGMTMHSILGSVTCLVADITDFVSERDPAAAGSDFLLNVHSHLTIE